jgi:hypothetical protein
VIAGQLPLEAVDGRQCHLRAVELADGDGPVEDDDRRGVEVDDLVVQGDDLRPVGRAPVAGGGVYGTDRGEDLVAAGSHLVHARRPTEFTDHLLTFLNA